MTCICVVFVCLLFICFPLLCFFSVDPETVVAPEYNYAPEDQFPSAELPGKQPPLTIPISPIPSLYILALDVGVDVVLSIDPIQMHSLIL